MKPVRDELEEIFNVVPKDGSNIKDEDDDDNGYSNIGAASTETFDEKAALVAESILKVPPSPALARPQPSVPVAEPTPVPAAPQEPASNMVPAAEPTKASDLGSLLSAAIQETPSQIVQPEGVLEAPASAQAAPIDVDLFDAMSALEKADDALNVNAEKVDNTSTDELETKPQDDVVILTGTSPALEKDGWLLTPPSPMFADFYRRKAEILPYLLCDGKKLPFDMWEKELENASGDASTSDSLKEMYEKMVFVQGWKDRVREIHIRGLRQFFLWKRFMEMLRAKAADIERTKVALADAPSLTHLWDFECYWCRLEALVTAADKVMRNLDSALDTLNRGVTIALQAHDRGIERYENTRPTSQSSFKQVVQADPAKFDSLDTEAAPPTPKKATGDGWDDIGSR